MTDEKPGENKALKWVMTFALSVSVGAGGALLVSWRDLHLVKSDVVLQTKRIDFAAEEIRELQGEVRLLFESSTESKTHRRAIDDKLAQHMEFLWDHERAIETVRQANPSEEIKRRLERLEQKQ